MSINAQLRITGQKPQVGKILEKFLTLGFSYRQIEDCVLVDVNVSSLRSLSELKRRFGAKRCRPDTRVEVVKMVKTDGETTN